MKILISFLLFISAASASAAKPRIDVKAELLVNGKVIASPRIIAKSGEFAEITQGARNSKERIRMKILAAPTSEKMDEIMVDMDLEYIVGERHLRSKPQVIAKAGSEATMTLEESIKGEKIQLKLTAKAYED